jgi:hypothetical protein
LPECLTARVSLNIIDTMQAFNVSFTTMAIAAIAIARAATAARARVFCCELEGAIR